MAKTQTSAEQNIEETTVVGENRKGLLAKLQEKTWARLLGVFLVFFALFMLVSFLSYLFTWWRDFDQVSGMSLWQVWSNADEKVVNLMGRQGAFLAHLFIYKGFGVISFLFPVLFANVGLLLLKIRWFKTRRAIPRFFFYILWISIFLGMLVKSGEWSILGGVFGFQSAKFLSNILGLPGLILLMVFALICFCTLAFNMKFHWLAKLRDYFAERKLRKASVEVNPEESGDENSTAVDNEEDEEDDGDDDDEMELDDSEDEDDETDEEEENTTQADSQAEQQELAAKDADELNLPTISSLIKDDDGVDFVINQVEEEISVDEVKPTTSAAAEHHGIDEPYDPRLDLRDYQFPTLDLLQDYGEKNPAQTVQSEELMENKKRIEETLKNFSIQISQIKATIGPTVTLYEIVPAPGVKISKIKNLEDDIALSLSALGIRIIAPIPGKGTIGIEVPNQNKQIVSMKTMLASDKFANSTMDLPIAFGKTISNESYITDLTKMPHLLMAGATGQGKSVGLNAIIASLLYKKHPSELKFVMVDPKKVELTLFNKIERHYLAKLPDSEDAIITDTKKVVRTLNSLCKEMDQRYDLLKDAQVKNIKEYNQKFISRRLNPQDGHRYLPYIVLIVDEFADLIMTAGKEVELPIARLAQLARAIGIHLVIATQRPSVNIITGTIKANFPARLAFRVTSKIDSRTILDAGGADQLIGRGDMLLSTGSEIIRLQCAFVDTPEIENVTEFIGSQRAYPSAFLLPEIQDESSDGGRTLNDDDRDELFEEAARLIVSAQQGSTSLIQRKLKLGYNRAGRLIDQLEAAGIVGPFEGSKAREVKIKDLVTLEELLSKPE